MNTKSFIQFNDEVDSGNEVTLLSEDKFDQVPMMSYLITSNELEYSYFAQTQKTVLWLNQNSSRRYDSPSLDTVQRIMRGEYAIDAYYKSSQFYCAEVLAEQAGSSSPIVAPMTRPKAGSIWQLASSTEAQKFLSLPRIGHLIGHISGIRTREGEDIGISINQEIIRHHILSGGTTGSGKSNTNVNLIRGAQLEGFCVLVYDMKPDYSEIDLPNDEALIAGNASAIKNVKFWALGLSDLRNDETPVSVGASDLDPAKLAQVIFYRPGEELQQEVAEQLMTGFADLQNNQPWTIAQFIAWLMGFADAPAAEAAMPFRVVFNKQTFNAVRSKITRTARVPSWIDPGARSTARSGARQIFGGSNGLQQSDAEQIFKNLSAGRVHVIRVRADGDERSYALFLDYAMRKVADLRRDHSATTPPVMHLIDEAADIFKSSNKRLALAMEGTVDEQIRKGRSLSIGFVLSSQSAGDIPERIRHNLNSVIVFHHHQPKILQDILPTMSDAVRNIASKLKPGEALVSLFKTHGLLRCRMHQSPARLHKPGSTLPKAASTAAEKQGVLS